MEYWGWGVSGGERERSVEFCCIWRGLSRGFWYRFVGKGFGKGYVLGLRLLRMGWLRLE